MAPIWSIIANRKDKANQQFWTEYRANIVSGCPAQPGDIVMLGPNGTIDPCLLPSTTGLLIEVSGTPVADQNVLNFIPGTGISIISGPTGELTISATGTPGECGSAAFLCTDDVGTQVEVDLSHPTHPGQLLISQPGNTSAIWADPQVQGLYAAGSTICPAPAYVAPTCIQPVLVGAEDPSGNLQNLHEDAAGNLLVSQAGVTNTTTGDTGPQIVSFFGVVQTNENARGAYITVFVGAVTGGAPSLSIQLQFSPDGGTTWISVGPACIAITTSDVAQLFIVYPTNISQAAGVTPQILVTGTLQTTALNMPLPRTWRLNYVIGGTTPSFTITDVTVNYVL